MQRSIVIPAFEAAASVGSLVRELIADWPAQAGAPAVLVVDDGSSDATGARAAEAGARVVRLPRNQGKGAALRVGFIHAAALGSDAVVTLDADAQHPPGEALRLLVDPAPAEALLLGVRALSRAGAPRANQLSNAISNFFLSRFARRRLLDTQCGLRRYPLPRALTLPAAADGFAFEAEFVLRAARAGWEIVERPIHVVYPPEDERVTHFHVAMDPARIIGRVLLVVGTTPRPR